MTRFIARLTIAWAGVALFAPAHTEPVSAQEAGLPREVREWLARDQAQRWARMLAEGDSIFNSASCRRCHGEGGSGGSWGPDLTDSTWVQSDGSLEGIRRTIFWGVRRELMSDPDWRFEMNPGGGVDLTWEQYASLAAYVWSLSNGAGARGGQPESAAAGGPSPRSGSVLVHHGVIDRSVAPISPATGWGTVENRLDRGRGGASADTPQWLRCMIRSGTAVAFHPMNLISPTRHPNARSDRPAATGGDAVGCARFRVPNTYPNQHVGTA